MAQETQSPLYDLLASRGVTRRDFMKFCGSLAAMMGLSDMYVPRIAAAVEDAAGGGLKPTLWLNFGSCTGCTESIAQVDSPDVATIVLDILSLDYNETLMAAAGEAAEANIAARVEEGGYILIVEGTVMTGQDGNTLRIAGRTGMEILEEAAGNAEAIIAVGSCAVDGGWVAANPNPAEGTGVMHVAEELGYSDVPIINLPTCPMNPEWVVATVIDYLILERVPELDGQNRPKLIFGQTIHDNCPRRGHFENNEFVTEFGSEEEALGYCLYQVGCKGPSTLTNCPIVRWNRRSSWCVEAGSPCIGCGSMSWVDNNAPFMERMADIGGVVDPETIGLVVGGAAAAGLVVHGIAQTATGRMGHGAPVEDEKGGE